MDISFTKSRFVEKFLLAAIFLLIILPFFIPPILIGYICYTQGVNFNYSLFITAIGSFISLPLVIDNDEDWVNQYAGLYKNLENTLLVENVSNFRSTLLYVYLCHYWFYLYLISGGEFFCFCVGCFYS